MTRTLLTYDDLARRLAALNPDGSVNRSWMHENLPALYRRGFPRPVVPRRWDPAAIDAWLDAQLPDHLRPAPAAGVTETDWAAALDAAAAGLS